MANQSLTADLQEAPPAWDSGDLEVLLGNLPVDHVPSIPRAQVPVDSSQGAQQVLGDVPDLAHVPDLAPARVLAALVQGRVVQLLHLKRDARNALRHVAGAGASSNIQRPKKAR